jgi:hypothetical protein
VGCFFGAIFCSFSSGFFFVCLFGFGLVSNMYIYFFFSFVECSQFHVDQIGRRINWASSGTTDGRSAASDQWRSPRPDAAIDVSRDANIVARTQATLLRSVTCATILKIKTLMKIVCFFWNSYYAQIVVYIIIDLHVSNKVVHLACVWIVNSPTEGR